MRQTILKYATMLLALGALASAVLYAQKNRSQNKEADSIDVMETSKSGMPTPKPQRKSQKKNKEILPSSKSAPGFTPESKKEPTEQEIRELTPVEQPQQTEKPKKPRKKVMPSSKSLPPD